jgi:hypothetical protein
MYDGCAQNVDSVPVLDVELTHQLVTKLDATGMRLATILTSQYVAPLQHSAAFWALKVKNLGTTLEQWLSVQERWTCLSEIFADPDMCKVSTYNHVRHNSLATEHVYYTFVFFTTFVNTT